jgi:hypothetical protein
MSSAATMTHIAASSMIGNSRPIVAVAASAAKVRLRFSNN